jgi:hypothetical protein
MGDSLRAGGGPGEAYAGETHMELCMLRATPLRPAQISQTGYVPPFFETDSPVIVGIDLGKEVVEVAVGNREAGAAECSTKFGLGEFAVVVVVDAPEQGQELLFSLLDEGPEF